MFNFFKNKKKITTEITIQEHDEERRGDSVKIGVGFAATESARVSTQAAAQKFSKPVKYNRHVLDDGVAKRNIKMEEFDFGVKVRDPYTDDVLALTRLEAQMRYGHNWTKHLAEADHKIPLEERYEQTKHKQWLTNDDIKASSNSSDNLEVVSRKFNNAKRSRSNQGFVTDDEYLEKTGIRLSPDGKKKAIESQKNAQKAVNKQDFKASLRNIAQTSHNAGMAAAKSSGTTGMTMSGIMNVAAVIKGEKSVEDAVADTVVDTGTSVATGYVMGGGLTTISHTLSDSSSSFLRALSKSNVPSKVITAVMITGDTLKRYGNGEITTQQCIMEIGEKGLNVTTAGYSMVVGQSLIPIPVVGAAVGALVGSMLTSNYYNQLITTLQRRELEHQDRLRIIAECERATQEARAFTVALEEYLMSYFKEYQDCFDDALMTINESFRLGDADGVISGANIITRKLGGKVYYDNMDEFKDFFYDDSTDIL